MGLGELLIGLLTKIGLAWVTSGLVVLAVAYALAFLSDKRRKAHSVEDLQKCMDINSACAVTAARLARHGKVSVSVCVGSYSTQWIVSCLFSNPSFDDFDSLAKLGVPQDTVRILKGCSDRKVGCNNIICRARLRGDKPDLYMLYSSFTQTSNKFAVNCSIVNEAYDYEKMTGNLGIHIEKRS